MEPHINVKELDGFSLKEYFENKNKVPLEFSETYKGWVRQEVHTLAPTRLKAIQMRFWKSKSLSEMTAFLGRGTDFIGQVYERSLKKLRKKFDSYLRKWDGKEDKFS